MDPDATNFVYRPAFWQRSHVQFISITILFVMLTVVEFSFSKVFKANPLVFLIAFKVAFGGVSSFLGKSLSEKLILAPFELCLQLTQFITKIGSAGFIVFITTVCFELGMGSLKRFFIEPVRLTVARAVKAKAAIKKAARDGKAPEMISPEEGKKEDLIQGLYTYSLDTITDIFNPAIVWFMFVYRKELTVANIYGIRDTDLAMYASFTFFILPFKMSLDIFLHNVVESAYGWRQFDYISECRQRFAERVNMWMGLEEYESEWLETTLRSLDKMAFTSQFFFMVTFHTSGMLLTILGCEMIFRSAYNIFSDGFGIPLIFLTTLCMWIGTKILLRTARFFKLWHIKGGSNEFRFISSVQVEKRYKPVFTQGNIEEVQKALYLITGTLVPIMEIAEALQRTVEESRREADLRKALEARETVIARKKLDRAQQAEAIAFEQSRFIPADYSKPKKIDISAEAFRVAGEESEDENQQKRMQAWPSEYQTLDTPAAHKQVDEEANDFPMFLDYYNDGEEDSQASPTTRSRPNPGIPTSRTMLSTSSSSMTSGSASPQKRKIKHSSDLLNSTESDEKRKKKKKRQQKVDMNTSSTATTTSSDENRPHKSSGGVTSSGGITTTTASGSTASSIPVAAARRVDMMTDEITEVQRSGTTDAGRSKEKKKRDRDRDREREEERDDRGGKDAERAARKERKKEEKRKHRREQGEPQMDVDGESGEPQPEVARELAKAEKRARKEQEREEARRVRERRGEDEETIREAEAQEKRVRKEEKKRRKEDEEQRRKEEKRERKEEEERIKQEKKERKRAEQEAGMRSARTADELDAMEPNQQPSYSSNLEVPREKSKRKKRDRSQEPHQSEPEQSQTSRALDSFATNATARMSSAWSSLINTARIRPTEASSSAIDEQVSEQTQPQSQPHSQTQAQAQERRTKPSKTKKEVQFEPQNQEASRSQTHTFSSLFSQSSRPRKEPQAEQSRDRDRDDQRHDAARTEERREVGRSGDRGVRAAPVQPIDRAVPQRRELQAEERREVKSERDRAAPSSSTDVLSPKRKKQAPSPAVNSRSVSHKNRRFGCPSFRNSALYQVLIFFFFFALFWFVLF
jgi:hypothetical protein